MLKLRRALVLGFALALWNAAPATARVTVVDAGEFLPDGSLGAGCTIGGAPCAPVTMPFSFDFGTGLTDKAYIYDSGIVSFGAPITGVDPTGAFTTFGVPVMAPLYVPETLGTPGPYLVSSGTISAGAFDETLPNFGTDLFLINFLDPSTVDTNTGLSGIVHLLIDASASELRFEFIHGMSTTIDGNVVTVLPNTAGTQMGFVIGNQQFLQSPPNILGINAFSTGVPEPGTWLMMLLGFAAMGYAFRRQASAERQLG